MFFTGSELAKIVHDCKSKEEVKAVIDDMHIDEIEALVGHMLGRSNQARQPCLKRKEIKASAA